MFFSLTDFNMLQMPNFTGLENYLTPLFEDDVFFDGGSEYADFAVITGPISYFACFFLPDDQ